ncbi:MAG: Hsp20/alpha crystallin family protein [Planctomycetota bacterium]
MRMVFPTHTSRLMDDLATDVGTLVEGLFGEVAERTEQRTRHMPIPMDIDEAENAYVVTLDVPGVSLDTIEIEFHEDTLSIGGSRPDPNDGKASSGHDPQDEATQAEATQGNGGTASRKARRRERLFGKFGRKVRLPHPIEQEQVSAALTDGVLVITLPKADPEQGKRRIPVSRG